MWRHVPHLEVHSRHLGLQVLNGGRERVQRVCGDSGHGGWSSEEDSGRVGIMAVEEVGGWDVPVEGVASGRKPPVDGGTASDEVPKVAMESDTRLLGPRLRKAYE